jgi:hypothetical protein
MMNMKTKILLVTVITAFTFNCFAGDKKGSETIKPPEHLSLSEFLPIWFSSQGKIKYNRNLVKVKQDDTFCYYSLSWLPERPAYKVRTGDLSKIDIDHLDVFAIHAQFQEKVVPAEDKRRFECQGYTAGTESGGFSYRYIEDKNAMEINCILKANCDFIVRAINKSYTAEYYFDTGEFIKTDEHEVRKKQ